MFNSIYKNFKSLISTSIPETEYFLISLFMLFLTWSDKYGPLVGFMLTKTFPYWGGSKVSPPKAETESVSVYIVGIIASKSAAVTALFWDE